MQRLRPSSTSPCAHSTDSPRKLPPRVVLTLHGPATPPAASLLAASANLVLGSAPLMSHHPVRRSSRAEQPTQLPGSLAAAWSPQAASSLLPHTHCHLLASPRTHACSGCAAADTGWTRAGSEAEKPPPRMPPCPTLHAHNRHACTHADTIRKTSVQMCIA